MGMIGSFEIQLGVVDFEQLFPEVSCESGIIVGDYRVGHSMDLEGIVH